MEKNFLKKIDYNNLTSSYISLNNALNISNAELTIAKQQVKVLTKQLNDSKDEINFCKAKLNKNSSNSNMLSSSDGLKKFRTNHRKTSGKLQGGQPDHAFSTLELSDTPTKIILVPTNKTCDCGAKITLSDDVERRQVIVLNISYDIIEYQGKRGVVLIATNIFRQTFHQKSLLKYNILIPLNYFALCYLTMQM